MRRGAFLLSLALLLGGPPFARSQPDDPVPPPPPESPDARPPVFYETTTVTARPVPSATGSVTVVGPEEVRAAEARSAAEILRAVPGLQLLSSGGRAGQTNAYLRGGDPNYTLVLLDGIPLNDSTDLQGGAVNLEELPAGFVERAEIVRGPSTSFYGTSSLSGVVQLFTPRGGPGPVKASLGAETGNSELVRGFARASGPAGERGGLSAGLSWDQERHRIAEDRFRQLDAWASASLGLGATTDLRLVGRFADGEADDYPDASGGPVYGSGELRYTAHRDLALGAQLETGNPAGRRHQLSVGLARRERDRTSPAVPPLVPASSEEATFTRLRLSWHVPLHRTSRTEVDAGASGDGEWGESASVLQLPPFLGGDVPGDYRETRWSGGAFAGIRHETALGGGRGSVLLEAALRADVATTDSAQLNPRAGVVVRPGGGTTRLRASAGRASKLPSFFALASPRALGGNPELRAESAWGGEAGLEHDWRAARLSVGATYFLQRYEDLVDFDFEEFLHVNRSRVRTQGVELTARWQPHPSLAVDAQATYLDAKDLDGGVLLHEPRWTGGVRLTWQPDARLSLRLQARGVAGSYDEQIPVPDRDWVDGYSLLGIAGSWRAGRGLTLRARLDNLADRSYETLIGFPGPGRSFWAGLGWDRP
jgi:outer membrane cobalamin receptor